MKTFRLTWVGAVFLAAVFSGCATLGTRTIEMNQAQLQQALTRKVSQPLTVLKVFHIQCSDAKVLLDPASARIQALMQLQVTSDLMAKVAHGSVTISGVPVYDAARSAVVLDQPLIEQIAIDGARGELRNLVEQLGKELGQRWLNQLVLYEVKPEALTVGGTRYLPTELKVHAQGVRVTLQPQP